MTWEYDVQWVLFRNNGDKGVARVNGLPMSLRELLAHHGREGWELVALTPTPNVDALVAVFKKPRTG